jgi:hypothetical protein
MDPEAEALARRAAERLAPQLGADLPANVEAGLQGAASPPQRYEPAALIALATLVLNIVKFAWDLRKDLRAAAAPPPSPEVIARRIRLEVALRVGLAPTGKRRLVTAHTLSGHSCCPTASGAVAPFRTTAQPEA